MTKRIKHNDLLPWFLQDHSTLPASYVKSCQKFFDKLQATSSKGQPITIAAPSNKQQATSCKLDK